MVDILITCLIGLLVGVLASWIMKKSFGWIVSILIGIGGGFLGQWLAGKLGIAVQGDIASFICAVVGAVILVAIISLFKK